jgi:histidinol-phosphate/aromatic aminotransferase/cobyric acid decarboxylase-like protein
MVLKFHTNENPYSLAKSIQKAARNGLQEVNRYPESEYLFKLKTLLGDYNNVSSDWQKQEFRFSRGVEILF